MKITDRTSVYYYHWYNSYRNEWDNCLKRYVYRERYPYTYAPKQWAFIGPLKLLKPNDYSASLYDMNYGILKRVVTFKYHSPGLVITKALPLDVTPVVPGWVENLLDQNRVQANVEFFNKLNSRKVSLLEELKNRKETLDTIASSVIRLARMVKHLKRDPRDFLRKYSPPQYVGGYKVKRRRRKQRQPSPDQSNGQYLYRQVSTMGDVWLEARYHWLPLYMTMRDAFIRLQDFYPLGSVSHQIKTSHSWEQTFDHPYLRKPLKARFQMHCAFKRGCWYTLDDENALLLRRYGVGGLPDLAAVVWELTPFSLAVDWFLPVSDVLLAASALNGLQTHLPWQVEKRKITAEFDYPSLMIEEASDANINYSVEQYPEIHLSEKYDRTTVKMSELPIRLYLSDAPMNWRRALDSLSFLMGTNFSKKVLTGRF